MRIKQVIGGCTSTSARAHVQMCPFPHLGNGLTDCAETRYVVSDPLARRFAKVKSEEHLHVRTCRCVRFPYLRKGWTDCSEIWCVARDPLASRFANI